MKITLQVLLFGLLINIQSFAQQHFISKTEKIKGQPIICPLSKEVHPTFNDLPKDVKNKLFALKNNVSSANLRAANNASGSTISVTYVGFPDNAKAAFQRAVDIWQVLVNSTVPIKITAYWQKLGSNILGSANTTNYFRNFPGANNYNTYYSVALAEKLAGRNLNGASDDDIYCRFSSDAPWYYGADNNVPNTKYDLTSVVLHELCHGLGFSASMDVSGSTGSYGLSETYNTKEVFDLKIQNGSGVSLIDTNTYKNPSSTLKTALTSGNVFYATSNDKAKLYAPRTWEDGSSISHLDELTYGPGTANSLMTPYASLAEKNLYPGPLTMKMMNEMGWKSTSIIHDEIKDFNTVSSVTIKAQIISDTSLIANSAKLNYYFTNSSGKSATTTIPLNSLGSGLYSADLTIPSGTTRVDYYLEVKDNFGVTTTSPANGGFEDVNFDWQFNIGKPDVIAPLLNSYPPDIIPISTPIAFLAHADDNFEAGIASVVVNYSVNGGTSKSVTLKKYDPSVDNPVYSQGRADDYAYLIENAITGLSIGDHVKYQVVATDKAGNSSILPTYYAGTGQKDTPVKSYFEFTVTDVLASATQFSTDFENNSENWATVGFSITQPTDFAGKGLHTDHPYTNGWGILNTNPEENNSVYQPFEKNAIAMLRVPIILSADSSTMTFDEIVLVEPGDDGSTYGDSNFYDYTVVEGSFDGSFWFPIVDGYDCRTNDSWNTLFTKNMTTGTAPNSTATPNQLYFAKKEINIYAGDITAQDAGQPLLLRFRMFADQWTNGWGWAIDNLSIQKNRAVILGTQNEIKGLTVYPNPASDFLKIKLEINEPQSVSMEIFNLRGVSMYASTVTVNGSTFEQQIALGSFAPGTYVMQIKEKRGLVVKKFVVSR